MEIKTVGDTLTFKKYLEYDGTIITGAVGSISVYDGLLHLQFATNALHTSGGTYAYTQPSTTNWPLGPTVEKWAFTGGFGTAQYTTESYRLIGTDLVRTYVVSSELPQYYENIEDFFDGSEDLYVFDSFNDVNSRLEALGYQVPFSPRQDGYFDQVLRDLNAYTAIFKIVSKRQSSFIRNGNEKPWFYEFKTMADALFKSVEKKVYNFDREIGAGESGISIATKTNGSGPADMETNWRGGVGNGFSDSSYPKNWKVRIIGTGTAGEIDKGTFVWSRDNGLSYATLNTGLDWQELIDGVFVRFTQGTSTGSNHFFTTQDSWAFKTFPKGQSAGGKRTAKSY